MSFSILSIQLFCLSSAYDSALIKHTKKFMLTWRKICISPLIELLTSSCCSQKYRSVFLCKMQSIAIWKQNQLVRWSHMRWLLFALLKVWLIGPSEKYTQKLVVGIVRCSLWWDWSFSWIARLTKMFLHWLPQQWEWSALPLLNTISSLITLLFRWDLQFRLSHSPSNALLLKVEAARN